MNASLHRQALDDLDNGRPRPALSAWRQLLQAEAESVEAHLQAAEATLPRDAVAPVRRQAIALARALLAQTPGETEILQLGALLQAWGNTFCLEVPSRALQCFERAWSCGRNAALDHQLAALHARLGYGEGAHWLAPPPSRLEPWPLLPCEALACQPCQQQPSPADPPLQLHGFAQGRIWVQRQRNPWQLSHGVGVANQQGQLVTQLCRHYPWHWPSCPQQALFQQVAHQQLLSAQADLPPPLQVDAPVLAIAELSGEMFFHWQLELLPRLGRVWDAAIQQWPNLRLWHNGGDPAYVREALHRLGIPPERLIPRCDHLQAQLLVVPDFASAFGRPAAANLAWLRHFWGCGTPETPTHTDTHRSKPALWLGRAGAVHRSVLDETAHCQSVGAALLQQRQVSDQLNQVAQASRIVAPHGAAMANLLAASPGSEVLELVNPAYQPSYFTDLIARRQLRHQRIEAAPTPWPLQEWLYEGPLCFPIDLRPGASPAAELLASQRP